MIDKRKALQIKVQELKRAGERHCRLSELKIFDGKTIDGPELQLSESCDTVK